MYVTYTCIAHLCVCVCVSESVSCMYREEGEQELLSCISQCMEVLHNGTIFQKWDFSLL